jgi:cytochrome c556
MRKKIVVLLAGVAALGVVGLATAEEKATGIVAVRQMTMKANGDHMGAIKAILTEEPQLVKRVAWHAEALAESAEYTAELFPEGSDKPTSNALPAVWSDQKGFAAAGARAENLAKKLKEAASAGDVKAAQAAFAALGKEGCGGCHETFRKKPQS